jgi:hypothetical protein
MREGPSKRRGWHGGAGRSLPHPPLFLCDWHGGAGRSLPHPPFVEVRGSVRRESTAHFHEGRVLGAPSCMLTHGVAQLWSASDAAGIQRPNFGARVTLLESNVPTLERERRCCDQSSNQLDN